MLNFQIENSDGEIQAGIKMNGIQHSVEFVSTDASGVLRKAKFSKTGSLFNDVSIVCTCMQPSLLHLLSSVYIRYKMV